MQDPTLDRQVLEVRELQQMWQLFHEFFKLSLGGEAPTGENEQKFLGVKSKIAMLHEPFMETLKEERQTGQNMMAIVARCITLRHVQRLTDVDIKKMNIEWHEAYLLLQNTIGDLEDKQEKMAEINPTTYHMKRIGNRTFTTVGNFFKGSAFRVAVILLVVGGGGWAFFAFGGMSAMKSNGLAAPVAYLLEDQYRTWVAPDLPFDNITRMWKSAKGLPVGYSWEGDANTEKEEAFIRTMRFPVSSARGAFEDSSQLSDNIEFEARTVRYSPKSGAGAGTAEVYTYRFPTTHQAKRFIEDYRDWRSEQPEPAKRQLDDQLRIVRMVNCICIARKGSDIMRQQLVDDGPFKYGDRAV